MTVLKGFHLQRTRLAILLGFVVTAVQVTGNKMDDHVFYWHTGYPGGIKQRTLKERLNSKFPERVISKAVERMLPKGPLGRQMLRNLKIYSGENHPHAAQQPKVLDVASMNAKNVKRS